MPTTCNSFTRRCGGLSPASAGCTRLAPPRPPHYVPHFLLGFCVQRPAVCNKDTCAQTSRNPTTEPTAPSSPSVSLVPCFDLHYKKKKKKKKNNSRSSIQRAGNVFPSCACVCFTGMHHAGKINLSAIDCKDHLSSSSSRSSQITIQERILVKIMFLCLMDVGRQPLHFPLEKHSSPQQR